MWRENSFKTPAELSNDDDRHDNNAISLPNFLQNSPAIVAFIYKFPRRGVDEIHFMRFQNETSDFKFHLGNVDGTFHWQVKVTITNYS